MEIKEGERYIIEDIGPGSSKYKTRADWIGLEVEVFRVVPLCRRPGYLSATLCICGGQGLGGEASRYGAGANVPFPEVVLRPALGKSADLAWSDFLDQLDPSQQNLFHGIGIEDAFRAGYQAGSEDRRK